MTTLFLSNGRPIEYDCVGDGPALLLIPGLGNRRSIWTDLIDALSTEYTVVSYDLRGYCGDEPGSFSLQDLAEDAAAILERLRLSTVAVVGHSEGGFIALELGLARPGAIAGLVIAASAAFTDEYGRHLLAHWREVAERIGSASLGRELLLWSLSPDYFNLQRRNLRLLQALAERWPLPLDAYLAHNLACTQHDVRERISGLSIPTLLLGGTADIVMSLRHNELLRRLIADSRLVNFQGVGHHLFVEAPTLVLTEVVSFLRQVFEYTGNK